MRKVSMLIIVILSIFICMGVSKCDGNSQSDTQLSKKQETLMNEANAQVGMPASAEGSWLMMVNPKTGKPSPCYFEPRVVVSPFPIEAQ